MKYPHILTLSLVAMTGLSAPSAYADGNFTSHTDVFHQPYEEVAKSLSAEDKLALRVYLDYEDREPCQNYKPIPNGFSRNGCDLEIIVAEQTKTPPTPIAPSATEALRPVIQDYVVHFDHDKSNIRASEKATLNKVAEEIKTYQPYEVTIAGHADRSGSADYNIALSQKRAQVISDALTAKNIPHRILEEEAHGESDPAVPTDDGVRLEENRRVEIQFRK